jgi:hypothetical protein
MVLPNSSIERYHFYLACLRSIIDSQKSIGTEFARQVHTLGEAKNIFIGIVKSNKDKQAKRDIYGRNYSWSEL